MKEKKIQSKDFTNQEMQAIADKFSRIVLFPEKVAKANETLKRVGLPKSELFNQTSSKA